MEVMAQTLIAPEPVSINTASGSSSPPQAASLRTFLDWATEIKSFLDRGKSSTIELARTVYLAKKSLHYGQWSEMWKSSHVPFSKRKGEMLASIGAKWGALDPQQFAHLPYGWSILYHLAQLPWPILERLIADRTIHPSLTLAEAKALSARFNGRCVKHGDRSQVKLRLRHFKDFIRTAAKSWSPAERSFVGNELHQLVADLENESLLSARIVPCGARHRVSVFRLPLPSLNLSLLKRD